MLKTKLMQAKETVEAIQGSAFVVEIGYVTVQAKLDQEIATAKEAGVSDASIAAILASAKVRAKRHREGGRRSREEFAAELAAFESAVEEIMKA